KDNRLCLGVRPRVAIEVDVENLVTSLYQTAALAYCGFVRQRLEECEDLTSRVAQPPSASVAASRWPDFCALASGPPKNPEFRASLTRRQGWVTRSRARTRSARPRRRAR